MEPAFWNERFGSPEYAYGVAPNDFLRDMASFIPRAGEVLSLAEGEGRNAVHLARRGFSVSAVDVSTEGKAKADRLAAEHGVSVAYAVSNLDEFDLGENRWDGIVSIFGYLAPDAQARAHVFAQIRNALKESGVFILEAYHPNQLGNDTGGPKNPDMLITLNELRAAFGDSQILFGSEQEREVLEGRYHTGLSCVTQFVVRKSS